MILFADGRQFQIAGSVLSDGTTIIPFSAIKILSRPSSFPLPTTGIAPPIMYLEMEIIDLGVVLAAMTTMDYNKLALYEAQRAAPARRTIPLLQQAARGIARRCGACGRR